MLDREQDKAINEARRRLANPEWRSTEYKRDYVAGIVAQHVDQLHKALKGKHPDADYDVIRGRILKWARTQEFDHPSDVQTVLLNRLRQLLARDKDLPEPEIIQWQ
jgi:hypothetical protein